MAHNNSITTYIRQPDTFTTGLSHILAAALSAYSSLVKELVWLNWLGRGNELYVANFLSSDSPLSPCA